MKSIHKQRGIGILGLIFILGLIALSVTIALTLAPTYMENFSVVTALDSLPKEPEIASKTKGEIEQLLTKRLEVNDVKNVKRENIEIKRTTTGQNVRVHYEVRKELFGNIDVVTKFDKSVDLVAR